MFRLFHCLIALPVLVGIGRADSLALEWRNARPFVTATTDPGRVLVLERSANLSAWEEWARGSDRVIAYGDWSANLGSRAFYRFLTRPVGSEDDWSNQLRPASGALFTPGSGSGLAAIRFAKFSLLLDQPDRVFFQDSVKWPYHYHFARARLPGYESMSILEYHAQSLYANASQRMVLGSVLLAPDPQWREVGIEVTGSEAFPASQMVDWVEAVHRRLALENGWRAFYLPSVEQRATAETHRALFEARGIRVDSLSRWVTANTCYSPGWALGRLVFVPGPEIAAALGDGRLAFGDILVTDRVPAELPVLAGYLATDPATPNSHVAILARSLLLPFAHANGTALQAEIASLHGREILLVVEETDGRCEIRLTDTTGRLTPERRQEILDSKKGGPLAITPKAPAGVFHLPVDPLTPADLRHVGGKAANFGFLRRSLPDDSPAPVLAFTFDLWDAYLDQPLPAAGQTLRQFIQSRLDAHVYPPDVNALRADLAAVRDTVQKTADFTAGQRSAIVAALRDAGLQGRKIRFRSSTNVEDSDSFSGAGLYDSYSGCLEDDLDGNRSGPSLCDPAEAEERGVFRAMRKVYASFYNENAFLERLRHGLDESTVGMALLVHFSSPDAGELANGVATLALDRTGPQREAVARIVTQLGAESVTNPDPTQRPETVLATFSGTHTTDARLVIEEYSSLTPENETVMPWESAYRTLVDQLNTASLAYEAYYPDRTRIELDFEFKRLVPGHVGLKQIRLVPHPVPVPPPTIP